MKQYISKERMENLKQRVMLGLSEEETNRVHGELERMVAYLDTLQKLDTDNVEPLIHLFLEENENESV